MKIDVPHGMTPAAFTHVHWRSRDGLRLHARRYAPATGDDTGGRGTVVCIPGLTRYAAEFGGSIGRQAQEAETRAKAAEAVNAEANARLNARLAALAPEGRLERPRPQVLAEVALFGFNRHGFPGSVSAPLVAAALAAALAPAGDR